MRRESSIRSDSKAVAAYISTFILMVAGSSFAIEPENGPQYLTDSHGAAGVAMAMLSLGEADPKYLECAVETLDWLTHVRQTDDRGRTAWRLSESAPEGHRNRRIMLPGQPLTIVMYLDAYEKGAGPIPGEPTPERRGQSERTALSPEKRAECRKIGLAGARWLAEVGASRWETDLGTAYGWGFAFGQRDAGLVAGHSHGLGKYINVLLRAHQIEPDPVFEEAIVGALVNLRTRAIDLGDGKLAFPAFKWPNTEDKDAILTGYCYGQAGVVVPLMQLAVAMPDLKLSDGTTPLSLGNSVLKYLAGEAIPRGPGFVWPYMRHSKDSMNSGLGSGTGGIGWAFLEGYRANREHGNDEAARQCLKYARGAAEYALALVERAPEDPMTGGGGDTGFGVCGGAGGTALLPMLLDREIGDDDPAYRKRVRQATQKIAQMILHRATPVGDALAWTLNRHEKKHHKVAPDVIWVNLALDYGQTGVILALSEMAKYLDDPELLDSARKAADFVIEHAVKTEHGWKIPRFIRVKQ